MRRLLLAALLASVLLAAACGADDPSVRSASIPARDESPTVSEPHPHRLFEADATVLDDGTRGPMLCLGGILQSLPPQCGDVPVAGWEWQKVEGEETAAGTTWGVYHVVGRYDGDTFTVTEVGPFERNPDAVGTEGFSSPCREPAGGWTGLDQATQNDVGPAGSYAMAQRDYVTSWVTHIDPAELEFSPVIFNAVFTGDRARHEAEIREVWHGPLCVVERDVPTARELGRIRKEVEAGLGDLGLQMLWSSGPAVEPVIEIGVIVDIDGEAQAILDARYGAGVVRLVSALEPVP